VDTSLSHCEQSWEGDVFCLVSPDTGLDAGTRISVHWSGNAAGGGMDGRLVAVGYVRCPFLPLLYFLYLNIPTGTFGIIREISHANQK